jgi:carbamoyl-phosphate synthase small subunit
MSIQNNPIAARLALSTGMVFEGRRFGATNQGIVATGEVVFNTAMTGYQESLTDPSYMGQILIQTQPMIGNTGTNPVDIESSKVQVSGFGVHEYTESCSNYRSTGSLDEYLCRAGVLGISGLDTRSLTRVLRSGGVVQGVLTDRADLSDQELVEMAKGVDSMSGQNLARVAGRDQESSWTENLGSWCDEPFVTTDGHRPIALLMDFGFKSNIARNLIHAGCAVELIPQSTSATEIIARVHAGEAHGLFLSNGPGDPEAVGEVVSMLGELFADDSLSSFPIYGICLGHQLISLALGATTYKLPFGHRGSNHPVHDLEHGTIQITSQNHGFAVDPESITSVGGVITHVHLNDQTVAGVHHATRPIAAVQFHPEASPGPHDASKFFPAFLKEIKESILK